MIDPILAAWLSVIARDGWADARIDAVAAAAGTTTGTVATTLPDRWSAIAAFGRSLDIAALADAGADRDGSVRDRLFGLLMARYDAAQGQRAAVRAIAAAARRDPALAAFVASRLPAAIARLADAAGVDSGGIVGMLRIQALIALDLDVARVWLSDDGVDLAATMKALDTRLAQAEIWARRLPYRPTVVVPRTPAPLPPTPPLLAAAPR